MSKLSSSIVWDVIKNVRLNPLVATFSALATYTIGIVTYRLFLSPLRKFPGPRIAAATFWYEFYYDVVQRGQYEFQIGRLHEQYGPVVRINPFELHISSPEFYNELYTGPGRKREKWCWSTKGLFINQSIFGTLQHDLHRERRAAVNPLFSKAQVRRLEPGIQGKVDVLLQRLEEFKESGSVIDVKTAFGAYTADVIMEYAFGRSKNKLSAPDFDGTFQDAVNNGLNLLALMNHLPLLISLMGLVRSAPEWLLQRMHLTSFIATQKDIAIQAREVMAKPIDLDDPAPPTIFQQILRSRLPNHEKTFPRLVQDGGLVISAGTVSTAWAITVGVYHLVAQPETLEKLKTELLSASIKATKDDVGLATFEKLPYLNAVVQEALRVSIGASHRSQRIAPDEVVVFTDPQNGRKWHIPPGTPMSMSQMQLLRNPELFPDPLVFRPERWIENPGLEKHQYVWGKGTRGCLGLNLAIAEMQLIVAGIFSKYGSAGFSVAGDLGRLELFETDYTDLECVGDGGVPYQKRDTKGVRFRVLESAS